ncbi:hypothetical protein [Candidatus Parabeggiatoa sp. HSG14]|uniref:hypothetical protein n=1 Tax=Candidatus Parabeggiatoa sp. HSG14 TaxID=3055593 RepID=UPI0025A7BAD3|nr:hypothetical protein [Thiotrichales bacterium HSG14]
MMNYKEKASLNFDLLDTVADQQIHEMDLIEDVWKMVLDALDMCFFLFPNRI